MKVLLPPWSRTKRALAQTVEQEKWLKVVNAVTTRIRKRARKLVTSQVKISVDNAATKRRIMKELAVRRKQCIGDYRCDCRKRYRHRLRRHGTSVSTFPPAQATRNQAEATILDSLSHITMHCPRRVNTSHGAAHDARFMLLAPIVGGLIRRLQGNSFSLSAVVDDTAPSEIRKPLLLPDKVREIRKLRKDGRTVPEIMRQTSLSKASVYRALG